MTPREIQQFVYCPVTRTSPAPPPGFPGEANEVCGAECGVLTLADVMHFICPFGHHFYATPAEVEQR